MIEQRGSNDFTPSSTTPARYTMDRTYREEADLDKDWERQYKNRRIHRSKHLAKKKEASSPDKRSKAL